MMLEIFPWSLHPQRKKMDWVMMNAFRKKRFVLPVLAYKWCCHLFSAVMSSILKCNRLHLQCFRQKDARSKLLSGDHQTDSLGHPWMILLRAYCKWISFSISQFWDGIYLVHWIMRVLLGLFPMSRSHYRTFIMLIWSKDHNVHFVHRATVVITFSRCDTGN